MESACTVFVFYKRVCIAHVRALQRCLQAGCCHACRLIALSWYDKRMVPRTSCKELIHV